jgi:hypothetical protein
MFYEEVIDTSDDKLGIERDPITLYKRLRVVGIEPNLYLLQRRHTITIVDFVMWDGGSGRWYSHFLAVLCSYFLFLCLFVLLDD